MFSHESAEHGLDLSIDERRRVESRVWALQRTAAIPVAFAPGYYSESPYVSCAPLETEEFNVDCRGNVTLCCHLSGHAGTVGNDVLASLHTVTLAAALHQFRERVAVYLADKRMRVAHGGLSEREHFPCWYCANYLGKLQPADAPARRMHVYHRPFPACAS
jgi:hypothetical protein